MERHGWVEIKEERKFLPLAWKKDDEEKIKRPRLFVCHALLHSFSFLFPCVRFCAALLLGFARASFSQREPPIFVTLDRETHSSSSSNSKQHHQQAAAANQSIAHSLPSNQSRKEAMQAPITVYTQGAKRESGKKAQFGNIMAAKVRGDRKQRSDRRR